jgi:hypothetical protein
MLGVIESVDFESRLGQEMRVSSLPARDVKDSRTLRKPKNIDYASGFVTITLECEDRLVFEQIAGIEVRLPPFD